jgi:hypothetical protein
VSQREPYRFDLGAALSRSLQPVDLRDFQKKNVNRVRLLRTDELAGSLREAIERALAPHRAELAKVREAERRATAEADALRRSLAEESKRSAEAEAAAAAAIRERDEARRQASDMQQKVLEEEEEARNATEQLAALSRDLDAAQAEVAMLRAQLDAIRAERDEARDRLAAVLVERGKLEAALSTESTRLLPTPPGAAPALDPDEPKVEARPPAAREDTTEIPAVKIPEFGALARPPKRREGARG